jgi:aryl-alcohol dehydrogenase-like predicted oxidoreductase
MPLVGLGTWQMTGARCQAAVRTALQVGYRHIDTATMYRNERNVGRTVRDSGVLRCRRARPAGSGAPSTTASRRWAWTTSTCG